MIQYPTSIEYSLVNLTESGHFEYIWLPLDPSDFIYMAYPGAQQSVASDMVYRNPIYMLFDGLAVGEKYNVEYIETWEYIPTFTQKPFAPTVGVGAKSQDLDILKDAMETVSPRSLLDGTFGRSIKRFVSIGSHATALFAGSTGTVGAAASALNLGLSVLKKGMR
jgi:hypothetical protein